MLSREEGFTFLELIMVVMIIGILVTIAVLSFVFSISASKKTVCSANLRTIDEQLEVYFSEYHAYPPLLQDLYPDYINSLDCLFCPDSGEAYIYDEDTGQVSCPFHTE